MSETPVTTPTTRQMSFHVLDTGEIRAEFGPGLDPLTINPATDVPESLYPAALAEGIISRLRAFGSKLSGEDRTPSNLRSAVEAGMQRLIAGEWKVERTPGTGGGSFTIDAESAHVYRRLKFEEANPGQTYTGTLAADADAFNTLPEDKQAALKTVARFQAARAQVVAARAAAKAAKLAKKADKEEEMEESDF